MVALLSWETVLLLVTWLSSALNIVLTKKVSEVMGNYSYVLIFMQGLWITVLIPFCLLWRLKDPTAKTRQLNALRWYEYVFLAALIIAYVFLLRVGNRGDLISGDEFTLITSCGPPPLVMLFSYLILGRRFRVLHFIGLFLVIGGLLMFVLPGMINQTASNKSNIGAILILLGSSIPLAISGITMERIFQDRGEVDVIWVMSCIAALMVPLSLVLIPLIPITEPSVTFANLAHHLKLGFACFFGQDSASTHLHCSVAAAWYAVYAVVNVLWNLSTFYTTKRVSAAASYTAQSAAIPVSALLFLIPVFGDKDDALTWLKGGAIAVVVAGLVVYRLQEERKGEIWWICKRIKQRSYTTIN